MIDIAAIETAIVAQIETVSTTGTVVAIRPSTMDDYIGRPATGIACTVMIDDLQPDEHKAMGQVQQYRANIAIDMRGRKRLELLDEAVIVAGAVHYFKMDGLRPVENVAMKLVAYENNLWGYQITASLKALHIFAEPAETGPPLVNTILNS